MTSRPAAVRASDLLAQLVPAGVAAYELRGSANPALLAPDELATCGALRPKRLEEFAAGRLCAQAALRDLDVEGFSLRRNFDRSPHWPDRIVGSITHTVGFCGAVAAPRSLYAGIGIDVELVARVSIEVWPQMLCPDEIAPLLRLPSATAQLLGAVSFSAKEAFYKAQFAVTKAWLDYRDVAIDIVAENFDHGCFVVRPATALGRRVAGSARIRGFYRIEGPFVACGTVITTSEAGAFAPQVGSKVA